MLRNSSTRYGLVAVTLHWVIALAIIVEFALGLYMTGLDYYHPWSQLLPHVHESVGILLGVAILLRIGWSLASARPPPGSMVGRLEFIVSRVVQWSMQFLMVAIVTFGYLVSTAEGDGVPVFDWFTVPSVLETGLASQEDISIFLHYWLAWSLVGLACLHALGALKHHFIDRDSTLRNMLGLGPTGSR